MTLTAADRLEIEQAIQRYARAFDDGDAETFVDVFTDDGAFEVVLVGTSETITRIVGRADLRAFVEQGVPGGGAALHHVSGVLFDEPIDDTVRTRCTLIITKQLSSGPAVVTHGSYEDIWRSTGAGWRLAVRRYVALGYAGRPATPSKETT